MGPSERMKAATYERYGAPEVIDITEVAKPDVGVGELLIRVRFTCVNSADARMRSLRVPTGFRALMRLALGVFTPRQPVLGTELAGVVEALGRGVTRFRLGDEVYADTGMQLGAHAEYKVMSGDKALAHKPETIGLGEAAAIPFGGTTALGFLRKAAVVRGEKVLINGASGAVGCAAVQLAKHFGAHVVAVCSGANAALVSSLGADEVVDYGRQDFTALPGGYDVIMDNVGNAPWSRTRHVLNPGGRLLCVVATLPQMLGALLPKRQGKKVICGMVTADAAMLSVLSELVDAGHYRPVIDRTYSLEDIAEAHAYCDTGRKKGSVLIEVSEASLVDCRPCPSGVMVTADGLP
ncbi:MAG: NAD(P)-dependent alcohol dehydrogenase [Polyangiales bacterium]